MLYFLQPKKKKKSHSLPLQSMGQFISLLEPDIFLFLGRRTPAASPEQRAPISARCNQLTSSLKRASSHAARLLQDGVHRGAMAGVRMEQQRVMVMMVAVMMMVVMVVTGTPQLASVRGWKLLDDPDGLRHYYKTGQRGGLLSVTPGGEATTRLPDDDGGCVFFVLFCFSLSAGSCRCLPPRVLKRGRV